LEIKMMERTDAREMGIARQHLEGINMRLIGAVGARRQGGAPSGDGDRAPASIATPAVELGEVVIPPAYCPDDQAQAHAERLTDLGQKTALRRVPRALARLGRDDPRYLTALTYLDACERLGSVAGQDYAGASGGGGVSDGGAVAGVQLARILARARAAINGWEWDSTAHMVKGCPSELVLIAPQNRGGARQPITAQALLDGVLISSLSAKEILERHGWSAQTAPARKLNLLFVELLAAMVGPIAEEQRAR
jgi:hypothetical protein